MKLTWPWQRGPSQFQRASDGSMSLLEHLQELRSRLFKATLAIVLGMVVGYYLADPVFQILKEPYCNLELPEWGGACPGLQALDPLETFWLKLKIALWVGMALTAPVWFYQIWMFIAPGLRNRERKWAYIFVGAAVPLFLAGAALAYMVVDRGLRFIITAGLPDLQTEFQVTKYVSFITTVMLVFAIGFELPLLVVMLNFAGILSARKLLSWWRVAVFLCFAFAAFATPDPGPFGMLMLASIMSTMYFIAVGIAFLHDRRKAKKDPYAGLSDDEISSMDEEPSPLDDDDDSGAADLFDDDDLEPVAPVRRSPVEQPAPLDNRYDDIT